MNNNLFLLVLIIAPVGLIIYLVKKKKKGNSTEYSFKKRREGDEVWKTLKEFLKNNGEHGKEIVESYVAKRQSTETIDKKLPKAEREILKKELAEKKKKEKEEAKAAKKANKKVKQPRAKELYVVLFVTRNAKTLEEDKPRAIECEVVTTKVNRKESVRKINVTKECSYDAESKWILPLKEAEEAKLKKTSSKKKEKPKKDDKKKTKPVKEDKWKKKEVVVKK